MSDNPFLAYVAALRSMNARCVTFLRPGVASPGVAVRAAFHDLTLPDDVLELWRAFDGVSPPGDTELGDVWLDGMFFFYSEDEAIEDYRAALSAQDEEGFANYWPAGFFPVASPGDGSRLVINCIVGSPTYGHVYELAHGEGLARYALSLSHYFETMLAWLDEGATKVTFNHQVEPDFDATRAIARDLNPGCDAWDENLPPAHESKDWRH